MIIELQTDGLSEMVRLYPQAPKIVAKELNTAIKQTIFTLLGGAREESPVDTGYLRGAAMQTQFGFLEGVLENIAQYAIYVHEGTKAHFPPVSAIAPWAGRHGIPPFLVARKISEKGTEGVPFFDLAIAKTEERVDNIFEQAMDRIIQQLS